MANNGRLYEAFVGKLQQAILNSEQLGQQLNISIEQNKKILDNAGIEREFDLYWEYQLGGITYKTVIECKDYTSKVSVDKIDAFIGKLHDLPELIPVFATKSGYQSGAEKKAKHHKIELLLVREHNNSDWQDNDGNPYIKEVCFRVNIQMPLRITELSPVIDVAWLSDNTHIASDAGMQIFESTDQILIQDLFCDEEYTIHTLLEKLGQKYSDFEYGENTHNIKYQNAFITVRGVELKILGLLLKIHKSEPAIEEWKIDFASELEGVIEYLNKGTKTAVYNGRVIQNWRLL